MRPHALSIGLCLLATSGGFAQPKASLGGVWRVTEEVWPDTQDAERGARTADPQPSLIIFTRDYYSEVFVRTGQPRTPVAPAKDPQNLTDAEKIARYEEWRQFAANGGTYEIKGSTLIRRVTVAKSARIMTRGVPHIQEFRLEGPDTIWLIPIAEESATEPRIKLTRLE